MLPPLIRKWCLALASTALSLAVAVPVVRVLRPQHSVSGNVLLVDTRGELAASLEQRLEQRREQRLGQDLGQHLGQHVQSDSAAGAPQDPGKKAPRWTLDEEVVPNFFPTIGHGRCQPAEGGWYVLRPNVDSVQLWAEHPNGFFRQRTNAQGLREDEDVRAVAPDWRIIFTGDSHIDGVVDNADSLPNRLEAWLALALGAENVEVLNAAVGGYTLHNYAGAFERLAHLEPDLFVVVVYGGNDFQAAATLHRYFHALGRFQHAGPLAGARADAWESSGAIRPQESAQVQYFLANPGDEALGVAAALEVFEELQQECARRSTRLLVAYLPPPMAAQPEHWTEARAATAVALECDAAAIAVSDRIADGMLQGLAELGIPTVDLRPRIARAPKSLYWRKDCHLAVDGHLEGAAELAQPIAELLPLSAGERHRLLAGPTVHEVARTHAARLAAAPSAALLESLTPPLGAGEGWSTTEAGIRFLELFGRPVVLFPASTRAIALRCATRSAEQDIGAVHLVVRTDGDFEVRVGVGARWSAPVLGTPTARAQRRIELPLQGARGAGEGAVVHLEVWNATKPVVLERVDLVR